MKAAGKIGGDRTERTEQETVRDGTWTGSRGDSWRDRN